LQGSGLDSRFIELARGARCRGEAFDLIALCFCSAADKCQCCRLARADEALDSLDTTLRIKNMFDNALLCVTEMRVLIGKGDGDWARKN
jgi:hypothetical protein